MRCYWFLGHRFKQYEVIRAVKWQWMSGGLESREGLRLGTLEANDGVEEDTSNQR